jgi:ATP-dependent helicase IRC3
VIELRGYQQEAIHRVGAAHLRGILRQLIVLPTGTGKTIIFASLIALMNLGRALVIAHRDELIEQAADKIRLVVPNAAVGIVKAERNEILFPTVVASVQTISRERRLDQLPRDFKTIIIDEAHHAAAESYKRILDALGAFGPAGPLVVGFTATADRADKQGLDVVFEEIVFQKNVLEMIREGYLADIRAKQVHLQADFNLLHTRNGEFIGGECEDLLMQANIERHGVEAYREHAAGRTSILFAPTVGLAHAMAGAFQKAGISSAAIDGTTDIDIRRDVLDRFKRGDIRVLANCMVLTEGFDEPRVDCILMARPTKSRSLYTQMVGRGTRLYPGKSDCLVIDFVGATTRHDLVTTASLFGINATGKKTVSEAVEEQEEGERQRAARQNTGGRLVAEDIDVFRNARLNWIQAGDAFTLSIGCGMLVMKADTPEQWRATFYANDRSRQVIAENLPLSYAQGVAEDFARAQGVAALMKRNAPWRRRPASEKQLSLLRKLGIEPKAELRSGEASDLITSIKASKARMPGMSKARHVS